ncbi:MAG TPA: family 20 glycosylhydrolase [Candidatus Mediterraneibacter intestinipullorum]|nr:family 20 glycosylhydrolase [Candidatus Mediterraneibacter intestinipullorum]
MYYTKDEFRDLIQTSRQMGIDIVPEFDTPAHSPAFTKVRPDLIFAET